jgi:hypothetical protein
MSKDAERRVEAPAGNPDEIHAEEPAEPPPPRGGDQKADPELLRQMTQSEDLAASSAPSQDVQAVFVLGDTGSGASSSSRGAESLPSPDETENMVKRVVERVRAETGKRVELLNVFRYLNSFVVSGEPQALRSLLEQPEIASAVANRQPGKVELLTEPGTTAS